MESTPVAIRNWSYGIVIQSGYITKLFLNFIYNTYRRKQIRITCEARTGRYGLLTFGTAYAIIISYGVFK